MFNYIFIVTGRTELELPDTRKRMRNRASYVDIYPFIWNEFKKHGYVTGKSIDTLNISNLYFIEDVNISLRF